MENIITIQDRLYPALAKEKIANQLATFTGGQKEKAISQFAASQLCHISVLPRWRAEGREERPCKDACCGVFTR